MTIVMIMKSTNHISECFWSKCDRPNAFNFNCLNFSIDGFCSCLFLNHLLILFFANTYEIDSLTHHFQMDYFDTPIICIIGPIKYMFWTYMFLPASWSKKLILNLDSKRINIFHGNRIIELCSHPLIFQTYCLRCACLNAIHKNSNSYSDIWYHHELTTVHLNFDDDNAKHNYCRINISKLFSNSQTESLNSWTRCAEMYALANNLRWSLLTHSPGRSCFSRIR